MFKKQANCLLNELNSFVSTIVKNASQTSQVINPQRIDFIKCLLASEALHVYLLLHW